MTSPWAQRVVFFRNASSRNLRFAPVVGLLGWTMTTYTGGGPAVALPSKSAIGAARVRAKRMARRARIAPSEISRRLGQKDNPVSLEQGERDVVVESGREA